jgi:hypothetical protein
VWEVFQCMGSLAIDGKTSHIWQDFPSEGSLHVHSKTAHVWEDKPHMASPRVCLNPGWDFGNRGCLPFRSCVRYFVAHRQFKHMGIVKSETLMCLWATKNLPQGPNRKPIRLSKS